MKTILLSLSIFSLFSGFGQSFEKCASHKAIHYQESLTPGFKNHVDEQFDIVKSAVKQKNNDLYVIPVVVHIVHNNANQNLEDSVIINQIESLNQDYQRLNADTVNMRSDFENVKGDPNIQFVLAQIDPDGNPTTGITRTNTSTASFGSINFILGDFSDLEKVKSSADGGMDPWDQSRYLNVWVCNMEIFNTPALLGYATPPAGLPNWPQGSNLGLSDGVVIQYQAFGSNNPNPLDFGQGPFDVRGRTLTHEVGHYLGLRHIWGDGGCTEEDGIDDTPNADAQSDQDCDPTKNSCTDNILGIDLPDMIENYMDYSEESCQNSFTQGQVDLMRGVLENQRIDLIQNNPASLNKIEFNASIYPNPVNDKLSVKIIDGTADLVELYDTSGKQINSFQLTNTTTNINLGQLEKGLYFIHFSKNGQFTGSQKLIKL
jgi:hypothetical protein